MKRIERFTIEVETLFKCSIEIQETREKIRNKILWDIKAAGLDTVEYLYNKIKIKEFRDWISKTFPEEIKNESN